MITVEFIGPDSGSPFGAPYYTRHLEAIPRIGDKVVIKTGADQVTYSVSEIHWRPSVNPFGGPDRLDPYVILR